MNDKKILFFDIDGTLLTPHPFKVPESTSRALTKAHENGHLLFINTGRTKVMMPSALSELHFDGYIYGCGTHIYMDNKLLFFRTVPNLLCKETVDLLRKCKIEAIFESNTEILYDGASPAQSEFGVKMRKEIPMVDITKFNREDACTYSYDKFLVHMLPDSDVEKFRSFCNDHYTYLITETESGKSHKRVPAKPQAWNFSWTAFPSPGKTATHSETVPTTFPC